jgi:RHS repeat-associated protein
MGRLLAHGQDASGQYHRRNRDYDAGTGRFTQEDPIGLAGGINLYGFADGNPISRGRPNQGKDTWGATACSSTDPGVGGCSRRVDQRSS